MPPDLPRLPRQHRRRSQDADLATFAALVGMCLLALGLLGMVSLVLPQVRGLLLVLFGGVAFFSLHYVVWGRWLTRLRERENREQRDGDKR